MKRFLPSAGLIAAGIVLATLVLIGLVALGAAGAIRAERHQADAEARARMAGRAAMLAFQAESELRGVDDIVLILRAELRRQAAHSLSPDAFDQAARAAEATLPPRLLLGLLLLDREGRVTGATRPDLIDTVFPASAMPAGSLSASAGAITGPLIGPLIGPPAIDRSGRQDIALVRILPGGALVARLDLARLAAPLARGAHLGAGEFAALIGTDGAPRAVIGPDGLGHAQTLDAATRAAITAHAGAGAWVTRRPGGGGRIYALHSLSDMPLTLALGVDRAAALAQARAWEFRALLFAAILSLLLAALAAVSIVSLIAMRNRSRELRHDQEKLTLANAGLAAAKADAEAKAVQLEGMLANMSDGVSLIDGEMRLRQWNNLFSERIGVPRELLDVGMTMDDILRIQARRGEFGAVDIESEVARRMARVRDPTPFGSIERRRPNGMTIELRRSPMPNGGFVTLYADITARKEAESAKRRAEEAAAAAVEAKAEFVANVAHEVGSPLNAVINSLGLLAASGLAAGQQRLVEAARGAGDALGTLITDILDIARMDAGQFRLAPEDFALPALLLSIVEMFRSQAEARGLTIALAVGPEVPARLHADARRLRQVLLNFLSNAVKFSSPGAITLAAAVQNEGEWRGLRLAVSDPGPRIAEADRGRLFQPFQRLEAAAAGGLPGSGLGLAISQRLAGLMGGAIGCEPTAEGNRFWITIPLTPARAAARPAETPALRRALPRMRILLVEDVPANQLVLAITLRREGHLVDVAGSGEAALAALGRRPYDIAFLDLHLPGINGLETARRIRTLSGPARKIPLVGLTGTVSADAWTRCLEAGMNDMLGKPAPSAALAEMLAAQLRPSRYPRAASAPPAPHSAAASLDAARIATLSREVPGGLFALLAEECLADIAGRLPKLRSALTEGNATEAADIAHAIAGTAATYGLSRLAALAQELSTAARSGTTDAGAMNPVEAEYTESAGALRALLAT